MYYCTSLVLTSPTAAPRDVFTNNHSPGHPARCNCHTRLRADVAGLGHVQRYLHRQLSKARGCIGGHRAVSKTRGRGSRVVTHYSTRGSNSSARIALAL